MMHKKENTPNPSCEPPSDATTIRCPRLGHQVAFSYCQKENMGLPCFKSLDCWHNQFNVHAHLKARLTDQDFEKIFVAPSKPKLFSLLDLIEQAKKQQNPPK